MVKISYAKNTKTQCELILLIGKYLIPPKGRKRNWQKHQSHLPRNNINEDVDIFKMGIGDMPF